MLCMVPQSLAAGCPIRKSVPERVCAPEHGLSQLVTSFIASESQGILHVPFYPFHLFSEKLPVSLSHGQPAAAMSLLRGI